MQTVSNSLEAYDLVEVEELHELPGGSYVVVVRDLDRHDGVDGYWYTKSYWDWNAALNDLYELDPVREDIFAFHISRLANVKKKFKVFVR